MMRPTLVVNVVGLTQDLIGAHTPHLSELVRQVGVRALRTITPAVTCSVQATLMTGKLPSEHGIVGNGWYERDVSEVWFWKQSSRLVQAPKVWDLARALDPSFTCANLFWWFNMVTTADFSVTPRPIYTADGRKIPDIYTQPGALGQRLRAGLGRFPLFNFWGPAANITSTQWIARATELTLREHSPTLTLAYLPHLDYDLQRFGANPAHPAITKSLRDVDAVVGQLLAAAKQLGREVMILSEYGITNVTGAVAINRALREAGLVAVREELGRELLDPGASEAFAVVDHQIAHVYVRRPERRREVAELLRGLQGVEKVVEAPQLGQLGLAHARAGDLLAISRADRWFSYYYWHDAERAPDFSRTVDIHRKPGYDPVELFLDPRLPVPRAAIAWRLLKRALGQRVLMDVISDSAVELVRGSHGRVTDSPTAGPVLLSTLPECLPEGEIAATDVASLILAHLGLSHGVAS